MRINTDNLDMHLERIRALALIGSVAEADHEHFNAMLAEMCEMTERAQACVRELDLRDEPDTATPAKNATARR